MRISSTRLLILCMGFVLGFGFSIYGQSTDSVSTKTGFFGSIIQNIKKVSKIGIKRVPFDKKLEVAEKTGKKLREENWKIEVILGELDKLANGLNDLRDFQLYPNSLTSASKKWAVNFDKRLEKREKQVKKIRNRVTDLRRPLLDAIAILKEMTTGDLNMDMLDLIQIENRERVKSILQLKRGINAQWDAINELFEELAGLIRIYYKKPKAAGGFDAEFFAILFSNLGRSSDLFYEKVSAYKDSLANKGDTSRWKIMANVDLLRINDRINAGLYKIAQRDLDYLTKRFKGRIEIGGVYYLNGQTLLALGRYRDAFEAFTMIDKVSKFYSKSMLGKHQALFLLEDYKRTMAHYGAWLDTSLTGVEYNFAILLAAQSAYRTEQEDSVLVYAANAKIGNKFYADILYTLAQVYLRKGDIRTGSSILQKVISSPAHTHGRKNIVSKAILTLGHLLYEERKYDQATKTFFKIINIPDFFAEALYGIVWSYLKSGRSEEAELTLKKLINQNPDHFLAVEGILVLAKKLVARADLEWEYKKFCEEEAMRINGIEKTLMKKKKDNLMSKEQIQSVEKKLGDMKSLHAKRNPLSRDEIIKLFDLAGEFTSIVLQNYKTGSYLEGTASGKRAKLIGNLSSLYTTVQATKKNLLPDEIREIELSQKARITSVKDAVQRTRVFNVSLAIKRRNWEGDYAKLYLKQLNTKQAELREIETGSIDSIVKLKMAGKIKKISNAMNTYLEITEQEKTTRGDQIINQINECRKEFLTGEQEQFLLYQLAELYYEKEKDNYYRASEKFELKLTEYDSLREMFEKKTISLLPPEPIEPLLQYEKATPILKDLIDRYPEGEYTDAALYSLAFSQHDLDNDTLGHQYFQSLVSRFPASQYAPQAYMIIGEFWFDNAEVEKAVVSYTKVLEYTESDWFDDALYKLGWSYYRLSKAKKAISSFMYLMKDQVAATSGSPALSEKMKSLLEQESIDYIAISFAEADTAWEGGLEKAKSFISKINDNRKGVRIMHKLADVYKVQGTEKSLTLAIKSYEALLRMFPNYEENPKVEMDLISVYNKQGRQDKTNEFRMEVFRKYNHNGLWAKSFSSEPSVVAYGDSIAKTALYNAATFYILKAAQNSDVPTYKKAKNAYIKVLLIHIRMIQKWLSLITILLKFFSVWVTTINLQKSI